MSSVMDSLVKAQSAETAKRVEIVLKYMINEGRVQHGEKRIESKARNETGRTKKGRTGGSKATPAMTL